MYNLKMSKMRVLTTVPFLILIALVSSCEGYTDRTWRITNATDKPLTFKVRSRVQSHDSLKIASGETKEIAFDSQLGGNEDPGQTIHFFTTIETVSPIDSSIKEFSNSSEWEVSTTRLRRVPARYDHDFKLVLSKKDI